MVYLLPPFLYLVFCDCVITQNVEIPFFYRNAKNQVEFITRFIYGHKNIMQWYILTVEEIAI